MEKPISATPIVGVSASAMPGHRPCLRLHSTAAGAHTASSPCPVCSQERLMDTNKCAHPACNCTVQKGGPFGKYCSEHCKEARDIIELHCDCKHPGCGT